MFSQASTSALRPTIQLFGQENNDIDYQLWLFNLPQTPKMFNQNTFPVGNRRLWYGKVPEPQKILTHMEFEYADRRVSIMTLTEDKLILGFQNGLISIYDIATMNTIHRLTNIRKPIVALCTVLGTPFTLSLTGRFSGKKDTLIAAGGNIVYYWPIGLNANPDRDGRMVKCCTSKVLTLEDTLIGPIVVTETGGIYRVRFDAFNVVTTEDLCGISELLDQCFILRSSEYIDWHETDGILLLVTRNNWIAMLRLYKSSLNSWLVDILFKKFIIQYQRMPELLVTITPQQMFITSPNSTPNKLDKKTLLFKFSLLHLRLPHYSGTPYTINGGPITAMNYGDNLLTLINSERFIQIFQTKPFNQLHIIKLDEGLNFSTVIKERLIMQMNSGQLAIYKLPKPGLNTAENCCLSCLAQYSFIFKKLRQQLVNCICAHKINNCNYS